MTGSHQREEVGGLFCCRGKEIKCLCVEGKELVQREKLKIQKEGKIY